MRSVLIGLAAITVCGGVCGGVAVATSRDDPEPETVSIHVQDASGTPMSGIRVAVWTPAMTSEADTPVVVTDSRGHAQAVIPGNFVRPKGYAIIPGDESALLHGWKETWKQQYIPSATAIALSDNGTANNVSISGRATVVLDCAATNSPGRSSKGVASTVVGSLFSGNFIRADEVLHAQGIPKDQACAIIVENEMASYWVDVPAAATTQNGTGPTLPEVSGPTGEKVRITVTHLSDTEMPPSWERASEINLIAADGSVSYFFEVSVDGVAEGAWDRQTQTASPTIHLPQGQYFVVPGMVASASIPTQRTWKALRDGRATELATAGLLTVIVAGRD